MQTGAHGPSDPTVSPAAGQDPIIPLITNSFCGHTHRDITTRTCSQATSPTCYLSGLILDSDHTLTHPPHTVSSHWYHRCTVSFEPWSHCNRWTQPPHQNTHVHTAQGAFFTREPFPMIARKEFYRETGHTAVVRCRAQPSKHISVPCAYTRPTTFTSFSLFSHACSSLNHLNSPPFSTFHSSSK